MGCQLERDGAHRADGLQILHGRLALLPTVRAKGDRSIVRQAGRNGYTVRDHWCRRGVLIGLTHIRVASYIQTAHRTEQTRREAYAQPRVISREETDSRVAELVPRHQSARVRSTQHALGRTL
jgi:hypothetical protein